MYMHVPLLLLIVPRPLPRVFIAATVNNVTYMYQLKNTNLYYQIQSY